ncbi:hypothetical protein I3760_10G006100 [Carya illinoinensis]|nr:hypothetical protein I3760_10G006100 [Carya illinoinensis]
MIIPQYSEKMLRDALVEMIIEDEMPSTTVEIKGFRKFIKLIEKQIIGFKEINDHKDASIGAKMDDCLKNWRIQKVLCITVDNFKRNTKFIHIQYYAHKINMIVTEGLKEVDDSITEVRNIVRYCLDVSTRWNSTYMIFDVEQKYQKVFEQMEVEDGGLKYALLEPAGKALGSASTHDWMSVGFFVTFLQIFYDIAMKISGSAYTIVNLWFSQISAPHHHLEDGCDDPSRLLSVGTSHSTPTPPSDDLSPDGGLHRHRRNYDVMNEYHQLVASKNIIGCTSEVERYFIEEVEAPSPVFDILIWWKANSTNTGGQVLDAFRNSLSLSTVEALVCT